jgi:hypothetical protein
MTTQTAVIYGTKNPATKTDLFDGAHQYIEIGRKKRLLFESLVEEFFDDLDAHAYFVGEPGSGKSHAVEYYAGIKDVVFTHFKGKVTPWAFSKQMAVVAHNAEWPSNTENVTQKQIDALPNIVVFCEDIPNILKDDFANLMRIVLDEGKTGDVIDYNISLGGQYKQSEKYERDAMDHFRSPQKVGFNIPLYGKVKFIFTMNSRLADENTVSTIKNAIKSPSKATIEKLETEAAIRSRFGNYHDLSMSKEEYWGWISDLLINEKILKNATAKDINQIITFLYDKWEAIPDRSIRYVKNVLWRFLEKNKKRPGFDYKARWNATLRK